MVKKAKVEEKEIPAEKCEDCSSCESCEKKKISPKMILLGIALLALLLFLSFKLLVVALVNNQPIWRLTILQQLEKQGGKNLLNSLISETLIFQEAKKEKIVISQKDVNDTIATAEANLKAQGQDLATVIESQGITMNDVKKQIELQQIIEKILGKDVVVTDAEIKDYLTKNQNLLPKDMTPEEASKTATEQLRQQKISEKLNTWLADLQKKANINYFINY